VVPDILGVCEEERLQSAFDASCMCGSLCCSVLQGVAVVADILGVCEEECLQTACDASFTVFTVLQCVAACCSVLQRVAACCSVVEHVAVC